MASIPDIEPAPSRLAGWSARVSERLGIGTDTLLDYAKLLTGQVGRLVFSLAYFLMLANALSLSAFGVFATASAVGVVLSRVAAFGFVSPLYRTACVRPRLVGSFSLGYLAALTASLPLVALLGLAIHALVFADAISLGAFALIVVAEVVLWRTAEVIVVVNNGLHRFARASAAVIANTAVRSLAALLFMLAATDGRGTLEDWALWYAGANALTLLGTCLFLQPHARLRWKPAIWLARWRDALGVAGAEVLFYLQSEMDKVVVLAFGGPVTAGLYAIVMRLADLTAIPLRSMMTLLIQRIMKDRGLGRTWMVWAGLEGAIALVSILGMGALALLLNLMPEALGENVATAAPFVLLVLAAPAFRNLVEFHTEILYAFERTGERLVQLAMVMGAKIALLIALLSMAAGFGTVALWLNGVFAILWLVSAAFTYNRLASAGFRTPQHGGRG